MVVLAPILILNLFGAVFHMYKTVKTSMCQKNKHLRFNPPLTASLSYSKAQSHLTSYDNIFCYTYHIFNIHYLKTVTCLVSETKNKVAYLFALKRLSLIYKVFESIQQC